MEELSYRELEKKVEILEFKLSMCHTAIARFLQNNRKDLALLLGESSAPINLEKFILNTEELIDKNKPFSINYENALCHTINQK